MHNAKIINYDKYGYNVRSTSYELILYKGNNEIFRFTHDTNAVVTIIGPTHIKFEGDGRVFLNAVSSADNNLFSQMILEAYDTVLLIIAVPYKQLLLFDNSAANLKEAHKPPVLMYDKSRITNYTNVEKVIAYNNSHVANIGIINTVELYDSSTLLNRAHIFNTVSYDNAQVSNFEKIDNLDMYDDSLLYYNTTIDNLNIYDRAKVRQYREDKED